MSIIFEIVLKSGDPPPVQDTLILWGEINNRRYAYGLKDSTIADIKFANRI